MKLDSAVLRCMIPLQTMNDKEEKRDEEDGLNE